MTGRNVIASRGGQSPGLAEATHEHLLALGREAKGNGVRDEPLACASWSRRLTCRELGSRHLDRQVPIHGSER